MRPAFADQALGFRRYDLVQLVPMAATFFEGEPADRKRSRAADWKPSRQQRSVAFFIEAPFLRLGGPPRDPPVAQSGGRAGTNERAIRSGAAKASQVKPATSVCLFSKLIRQSSTLITLKAMVQTRGPWSGV